MIYWLGWFTFRVLLALLGRYRVTGTEQVPASGAAILAANHLSFADPPVVGAGFRRKAWFMAKEELFRSRPLVWLLNKWQAFPVRRGASDMTALKKSLQILANGELLIIFPEGTRQTGGQLGEPELGVGMLAVRSGAPVVPVYITGSDRLLPKGSALLHTARVRVRYGPPSVYRAAGARPAREDYQAAADGIMRAIAELARVERAGEGEQARPA